MKQNSVCMKGRRPKGGVGDQTARALKKGKMCPYILCFLQFDFSFLFNIYNLDYYIHNQIVKKLFFISESE